MFEDNNKGRSYPLDSRASSLGEMVKEIERLTDILEKEADNELALLDRAHLRVLVADYRGAVFDYSLLISLRKENVTAYLGRSLAQLRLARYQEAYQDATSAIEIRPENPKAYICRGKIYYKWGKLEEAMSDFQTATLLDVMNPEPYKMVGMIKQQQNKHREALEEFDTILDLLNVKDVDVQFYRGLSRYYADDYKGAVDDFSEVLKSGEDSQSNYFRGLAFQALEQHEKAIEDFNKVLSHDINNGEVLFYRGASYAKNQHNLKAFSDLAKAKELNPDNPDVLKHYGLVCYSLEKYGFAKEVFERLVNSEENDPAAYYHLALAQEALGNRKSAKDAYDKSITIDKVNLTVLFARALNNRALDLLDDVLADYSAILKLDSQNCEARFKRGEIYLNQEQYKNAFDDFTFITMHHPNYLLAFKKRKLAYEYLRPKESATHRNSVILDGEVIPMTPDKGTAIQFMPSVQSTLRGMAVSPLKKVRTIPLDGDDAKERPSAITRRANQQIIDQDYIEALESYSKVLEQRPNNMNVRYLRAHLSIIVGTDRKETSELFQADMQLLTRAEVHSASECYIQAMAYLYCGAFQPCLDTLNETLKLDPQYAKAHYCRGIIYFKQDKYKLAIEAFSQAIEINAQWPYFYFHRAKAYLAVNELSKAEEDFDKIRKLLPEFTYSSVSNHIFTEQWNDHLVFSMIGSNFLPVFYQPIKQICDKDKKNQNIRFSEENLPEKEEESAEIEPEKKSFTRSSDQTQTKRELKRVKTAQPSAKGKKQVSKKSERLFEEGTKYFIQLKMAKAEERYLKATKTSNRFIAAYYMRAYICFIYGQSGLAKSDFQHIAQIKPTSALGFYMRAVAQIYTNTETAFEDINQSIGINASFSRAYNLRGILYALKGEYPNALDDLKKAISIEADTPFFYINQAVIYDLMEKHSESEASFIKAKKLFPENSYPFIYRHFVIEYVRDPNFLIADPSRRKVLVRYKAEKPKKVGHIKKRRPNRNRASKAYDRGNELFALSSYQSAIDSYRVAISYSQHFFEAYYMYIYTLIVSSREQEAKAVCRDLIYFNPCNAIDYHVRGVANYLVNNVENSISDFCEFFHRDEQTSKTNYDKDKLRNYIQDYLNMIPQKSSFENIITSLNRSQLKTIIIDPNKDLSVREKEKISPLHDSSPYFPVVSDQQSVVEQQEVEQVELKDSTKVAEIETKPSKKTKKREKKLPRQTTLLKAIDRDEEQTDIVADVKVTSVGKSVLFERQMDQQEDPAKKRKKESSRSPVVSKEPVSEVSVEEGTRQQLKMHFEEPEMSVVFYFKKITMSSRAANQHYKVAKEAYKQEDFQKVLHHLSMVIKYNPKRINPYYMRARLYFIHGQYAEANIDIKKIVKLKPKNYMDHFYQGIAYCFLVEQRRSIDLIIKAISLDPDLREVSYNSEVLKRNVTDYLSQIIDLASDALTNNPRSFFKYFNYDHFKGLVYNSVTPVDVVSASDRQRTSQQVSTLKSITPIQKKFSREMTVLSADQYPKNIDGLQYGEIFLDKNSLYMAVSTFMQLKLESLFQKVEQYIDQHQAGLNKSYPYHDLQRRVSKLKLGKQEVGKTDVELLIRTLQRPIVIIDYSGRIKIPKIVAKKSDPIFIYYTKDKFFGICVVEEQYSPERLYLRLSKSKKMDDQSDKPVMDTDSESDIEASYVVNKTSDRIDLAPPPKLPSYQWTTTVPSVERQDAKTQKSSNVISSLIPFDTIKLGKLIGVGSFGTVFKAKLSGKSVALKQINNRDLPGPALKELENEVVKLKQADQHPHLIEVQGITKDDARYSILMRYAANGNLASFIKKPANTTWPMLYKIASEISDGLAYIHALGIVYYGLKASNVLIDSQKQVKLTDFGMVQIKQSINPWENEVQSHKLQSWKAPEIFGDKTSDLKGDIFSLGMLLLHLVKGNAQEPITTDSLSEHVEPPGHCPVVFADVIRKCTKKDPTKRPCATEVRDIIQAQITQERLSRRR